MCATKKSLDCFASLAMTAFYIHAKPRSREEEKPSPCPLFKGGVGEADGGLLKKN